MGKKWKKNHKATFELWKMKRSFRSHWEEVKGVLETLFTKNHVQSMLWRPIFPMKISLKSLDSIKPWKLQEKCWETQKFSQNCYYKPKNFKSRAIWLYRANCMQISLKRDRKFIQKASDFQHFPSLKPLKFSSNRPALNNSRNILFEQPNKRSLIPGHNSNTCYNL